MSCLTARQMIREIKKTGEKWNAIHYNLPFRYAMLLFRYKYPRTNVITGCLANFNIKSGTYLDDIFARQTATDNRTLSQVVSTVLLRVQARHFVWGAT